MLNTFEQSNHCLNCGTSLKGNFCHYCGQEKIRHREGFFHTMFHFLGDFIHFDAMIFGTMVPLLFKPGFLVKQFEAGRRVNYLNPIKMYVFLSFVFFSVLYFMNHHEEKQLSQPEIAVSEKAILDSVQKNLQQLQNEAIHFDLGEDLTDVSTYEKEQNSLPTAEKDGFWVFSIKKKIYELISAKDKQKILSRFSDNFLHNLPKVLFILLPFFALVLKLLYIRRKYYYVSHLIFTIQFFNFIFLGSSIVMLCSMVEWLTFISTWWLPLISIYLWIALYTVYEQGWFKTTIKFLILNFISIVLMAIGMALNTVYSIYNS